MRQRELFDSKPHRALPCRPLLGTDGLDVVGCCGEDQHVAREGDGQNNTEKQTFSLADTFNSSHETVAVSYELSRANRSPQQR